MSRPGIRRYRDKLLFALAYGAVVAAVLFLHPLASTRAPASMAVAVEATR